MNKFEQQGIEKQSPKIELPKDSKIITNLESKLEEYKQRFEEQKKQILKNQSPEAVFLMLADTHYKIVVCEKLLLYNVVNTNELSRQLSQQDGQFDSSAFDNACGVIEDYITTGGKETFGSTGFGDNKMISDNEEISVITNIPENLTKNFLLFIDKIQNGQKISNALTGKLMNEPIEVGKHIETAMGSTSEVEKITKTDNIYVITTKSGSEYHFDPNKSVEIPDYLKQSKKQTEEPVNDTEISSVEIDQTKRKTKGFMSQDY